MSDHRGEKAVFHFAGLPGHTATVDAQCIYDQNRAGEKDDPAIDLGKANNYAHRLVTGDWRCDGGR